MKKIPLKFFTWLNGSTKRLSIQTSIVALAILTGVSCDTKEVDPVHPVVDPNALFLDFSTNGQTLPTFIHGTDRQVTLEVDHNIDITDLTPEFNIPDGYTVYANGVEQVSGSSKVDFSHPVTYQLRDDQNNATSWEVSVVPLGCKILIDASHDGGGWWFPQYEATGFDPDQYHQGQDFANILRGKGFEVSELGRGKELTEEMFFGHYIVIRVGGFQAYTANELQVYTNLLDRGMNLVFFTDHKKYDAVDELGDHLGLEFKGIANGTITTFAEHEITTNLESLSYIAGSVLMNANENPNIEVLGWLGENEYADLNFNDVQDENEPVGAPVMGVLTYPNSRIFFIGDMNGIEVRPQPFIDNLIGWMGSCAQW